jgi:endo-1,4-beta-xylanase
MEPANLDNDPGFRALVAAQSGLLVAENALKWDALRPSAETFDFARADRLADQARDLGLPARGQGLVWHEALPPWFPKTLDAAAAERLLTGHIQTVVGRYAGRIAYWDVAMEVIEGLDRRDDQLRASPWLKALGPDYIELAFRTAHAADPAAKLALCDYGLEYDDIAWNREKRGRMLWLLDRLLARGCPIHALGLQSHLVGGGPQSFGPGLAAFLRDVAGLGLDIWISELDVDDQKTPGDVAARDRAIADIYRRYLSVVLDQPKVTMVATWGLSDRYTSKNDFFPRDDRLRQRPLPFDDDLRPKPAFDAMMAAF